MIFLAYIEPWVTLKKFALYPTGGARTINLFDNGDKVKVTYLSDTTYTGSLKRNIYVRVPSWCRPPYLCLSEIWAVLKLRTRGT